MNGLRDIPQWRLAFADCGVDLPVHFAADGHEVIEYLEGNPPFDNPVRYPLPNLMLVDLDLPRLDGFKVLEWVRSHPRLCRMFIVALTSSDRTQEMERAYGLGADSCIVRPEKPGELVELVSGLQRRWADIKALADPERSAWLALAV